MENRESAMMYLGTMLLNVLAWLDRGTITFALGVIVSLLAITNYVLGIIEKRRNLKR